MKEAKLTAAQTVIAAYAESYRNRKQQLNACEIALYEAAIKLTLKAIAPPKESRPAIEKFETQLSEQRQRAEVARLARLEKKPAPTVPAQI